MNRSFLGMSHVSLLSQLPRYSDEELARFAKRIKLYDFLRVFATGGDDGVRPLSRPFIPFSQEGDKYIWNLQAPDPVYFNDLVRLHDCLNVRGVRLFIDIYNSCQHRAYDDPWSWNNSDIRSWWDTTPQALDAFKRFVNKLKKAAPTCMFGLGNELAIPEVVLRDWSLQQVFQWAKDWAKPRVAYLKEIGQGIPILFSGSGDTSHKIMGALGTEDGAFPEAQVALVFHGIGMIEHIPKEQGSPRAESLRAYLTGCSTEFCFGWSDDGVFTADWNWVPPEKRGPGNAGGTNFPANTPETIKVIQLFRDVFQERFISIDVLPRRLSDSQRLDELTDEEAQRGPAIIEAVYGIKLEKEPWMLKIEVCDKTGNLPNDTCTKKEIEVSEDDPEKPVCEVNHKPPKPQTCSERFGKPWTKKWNFWPWLMCKLGKK